MSTFQVHCVSLCAHRLWLLWASPPTGSAQLDSAVGLATASLHTYISLEIHPLLASARSGIWEDICRTQPSTALALGREANLEGYLVCLIAPTGSPLEIFSPRYFKINSASLKILVVVQIVDTLKPKENFSPQSSLSGWFVFKYS